MIPHHLNCNFSSLLRIDHTWIPDLTPDIHGRCPRIQQWSSIHQHGVWNWRWCRGPQLSVGNGFLYRVDPSKILYLISKIIAHNQLRGSIEFELINHRINFKIWWSSSHMTYFGCPRTPKASSFHKEMRTAEAACKEPLLKLMNLMCFV